MPGEDQLVPPVAELRLMRLVQTDLLDRTAGGDGADELAMDQRALAGLAEDVIRELQGGGGGVDEPMEVE